MKKKSKITIIIVLSIIMIPVVIFSFFAAVWALIFAGVWASPNPPEPAVKYAEFPFQLVYKMDGEIITVDDVYVCEYDGVGADEGVGKYRKWKGYVKSTGEEDIFIKDIDGRTLFCSVGGSPEYQMGDENEYIGEEEKPTFVLQYQTENIVSESWVNEEELKTYNIEVISYSFPPPIENTFE